MVKPWLCLLLLLPASMVSAAPNPEWTTPLAPFRIADNLYYVGSKDLASYLVVVLFADKIRTLRSMVAWCVRT
jgi:hypothetical protein